MHVKEENERCQTGGSPARYTRAACCSLSVQSVDLTGVFFDRARSTRASVRGFSVANREFQRGVLLAESHLLRWVK